MIRSREHGAMVPREQPDNRGLGEVLERAADGGPAEAELQRQEADRERAEERRTVQATKTLFVDALYRAKRLNGDVAFDMVDMADLESLLRLAGGITERRLSRGSDSP